MNRKFASIDGFKNRRTASIATKKAAANMAYYKPRVAGQKKVINSTNVVNTVSQPIKRAVAQLANREVRHQRSSIAKRTIPSPINNGAAIKRDSLLSKKRTPEKQLEDFLDVPNSSSKQPGRPNKKKKRAIIKIALLIVVLVAGFFAYRYASRLMKAANVIGGGSIIDIFTKADPLKADEQGRTNFLVFGTESNNINSQHGGPLLTDSLMIISFDNKTSQTSMISIPRDLWVRLESTCFVGNRAKVNTVYQCGSNNGKDEKAGAEALGRKLGQITGLSPHYHLHLSFKAVEDIVNAIGGVEVIIESPDPRGIYDINTGIKLKNGPSGLLNGQQALNLIRARNSEGGYGLSRSNYDREDNQRKVVAAMAKKMANDGVFNNFEKMLKIIESLGDNLRTNITASEVRSVAATFKKISSQFSDSTMHSISLADVTKSDSMDGQSVVVPRVGFENYSEIKKHINRQMSGQDFTSENPTVIVLNGSDKAGVAQKLSNQLTEQGFVVRQVGNASENISGKGLVFQRAGVDKAKSFAFLKSTYSLANDASQANKHSNDNADFLVIIGPDFEIK